jgi:hypothetical protein
MVEHRDGPDQGGNSRGRRLGAGCDRHQQQRGLGHSAKTGKEYRPSSSRSRTRLEADSSSSLSHPDGNLTGFQNFEPAIGGKWLGLLREVAPRVARAAVIVHPDTAIQFEFVCAVETVAPSLGVQVSVISVRDGDETERGTRSDRIRRKSARRWSRRNCMDRSPANEAAPSSPNLPMPRMPV